jgi:xanthine phosphoribosyltransferase
MVVIKALEQKILAEGKIYPGNVLKVGSFLNHQLDVDFLMKMGEEIDRLYKDCGITKILTIETSGIAIAFAAATRLHIPVVFAKKSKSLNISSNVYTTQVTSYTYKREYKVVVEKDFLNKDDKVLIVDDFLASGCALEGLMDLVKQADAQVMGIAVAIEKGFQMGGDRLRAQGIRVESLAIIDSMDSDKIVFREQ